MTEYQVSISADTEYPLGGNKTVMHTNRFEKVLASISK